LVSNPVNQPPTCSISEPSNGATFEAPCVVTISVTAADSDGGVAQVEFFVDGVSLGVDYTAPYQCVWTVLNANVGSFVITATAMDDYTAIGNSASVSVLVSSVSAGPGPEPEPEALDPGTVLVKGGRNGYADLKNSESITIELMPAEAGSGTVSVKIYSLVGRLVRTYTSLITNNHSLSFTWDGLDEENNPVSSGVYIAFINGGGVDVKKRFAVVR
jgi:hypothetical protein